MGAGNGRVRGLLGDGGWGSGGDFGRWWFIIKIVLRFDFRNLGLDRALMEGRVLDMMVIALVGFTVCWCIMYQSKYLFQWILLSQTL